MLPTLLILTAPGVRLLYVVLYNCEQRTLASFNWYAVSIFQRDVQSHLPRDYVYNYEGR
jgi:hypothetical protein